MNDAKIMTEAEIRKVMGIDCYLEWLAREGLPVTESFAVDLLTVPTVPVATLRSQRSCRAYGRSR